MDSTLVLGMKRKRQLGHGLDNSRRTESLLLPLTDP